MPGPLLAAGIAAGANLIGGVVNNAYQQSTNRASRRWQEKMYDKQRADNLSDWSMSNEYNSPQQQMARLKMAGLNPNLVYGNGAQAGEAAGVKAASHGNWNPQAPELPLGTAAGAGIAAYQDARLKDAQIDLLKEREKNLVEDSRLKAIKGISESVRQALDGVRKVGGELANKKAAGLMDSQFQAAQLGVDRLKSEIAGIDARTEFTTNSDRRADNVDRRQAAITAESLMTSRINRAKTQAEIDNLALAAQNMIKDGVLKQLEMDMRSKGASWSDPLWQRQLMKIWDKYLTPKKGSVLDKMSDWLQRSH